MLTRIWWINPVRISNQRPFCLGPRIVRAIDLDQIDLCQLMDINAGHELGPLPRGTGQAQTPSLPASMQLLAPKDAGLTSRAGSLRVMWRIFKSI